MRVRKECPWLLLSLPRPPQPRRQPAAAAAAPAAAPAAAVVAEPPVVVEPARPDAAYAPTATPPISAFPARPALIAPNGRAVPVPLEEPIVIPEITGRPDAPPMPMPGASPAISAFPARPAGPQLPMPAQGAPEVPVIDTGQAALPATGSWIDALMQPIGRTAAPSDFPARPGGPQLPMPAQGLPEEPVSLEPLDVPTLTQAAPASGPGLPTSIALPQPTAPVAARPDALPLTSRPEAPVSLEPLPGTVAGTPAAPELAAGPATCCRPGGRGGRRRGGRSSSPGRRSVARTGRRAGHGDCCGEPKAGRLGRHRQGHRRWRLGLSDR